MTKVATEGRSLREELSATKYFDDHLTLQMVLTRRNAAAGGVDASGQDRAQIRQMQGDRYEKT
jgi:hypothetical protein